MSTIQLPDLETLTDNPNESDFLLIRKSGSLSDQKIKYFQLIKNILPSLNYNFESISSTDLMSVRRLADSEDKKVTFGLLCRNIDTVIGKSSVFEISFIGSNIWRLQTSIGLPVLELKKNMEFCFTPTQDYTATSQVFLKVDSINESYELLYGNLVPVKELKKNLEMRVIFDGAKFLVSTGYYTNRPFSVDTKNDLPSAASNDGVIYYVKDQQKLVMSINSQWLIVATIAGEIQ